MTKGINSNAYACAFDDGPIYAYGFRMNSWSNDEPGIEITYSGLKYDGNGGWPINEVCYKYFPNPTFNISAYSYMWLFTRTPRDGGVAALNA
jgi:hypothetical protein